ncbi:MAG: hypothetical protein EOO81_05280 [Oxalobacteraceae bacterium]|nr:MAG: hypothetical protein EOO81_05280 [Oxalobacteraceae bacterium]
MAKLDGHYPVSLWLDFIVNRPDIDGNNAVRLVADGHSPVAVTLAEFSLTELTVIEPVHFRPAIRDSIYALALFDADGVMMAWGASVARTAGFDQSISIDLPPHQIRVRRILP